MATKTVVCPECGASAAPGRFACAQCGALLAAVGMQPRELATLEPATTSDVPHEASSADDGSAEAGVIDPGFDSSPELDLPPTPVWPPAPSELPSTPVHAAPEAFELRTPAGTYLPLSAVLPPLAGPAVALAAGGAGSATASVADAPTSAERHLPSLDGLLDGIETPAHLTRRTVGVGAAIAAMSFLLPWINGLPGAGFNGYLDRWGLAGPGLWIVFLVAGAVGAIALSSGRTATWPVGLPAVALGGLMGGLVWPSVFGGGAAIGAWFAFVGALVLVVGGALDLRGRHASTESSV